jgi:nucleoid-associated protein YgaU
MKTLSCFALLAGLLACGGCMTPTDPAMVSGMQQDMGLIAERIGRLQDRLQAIELEQQDIRRELQAVRQAQQTADQPTRQRLELLEKRVLALDAAREQDRKAIIDDLSRKVSSLMSASGGSSRSTSSSSGRSGTPSGGGSDVGYEHVVQSGETLSEIAKAYGVSMNSVLNANGIKSANLIRVGQKLFIPKP